MKYDKSLQSSWVKVDCCVLKQAFPIPTCRIVTFARCRTAAELYNNMYIAGSQAGQIPKNEF